jgi:hypothetical protein
VCAADGPGLYTRPCISSQGPWKTLPNMMACEHADHAPLEALQVLCLDKEYAEIIHSIRVCFTAVLVAGTCLWCLIPPLGSPLRS